MLSLRLRLNVCRLKLQIHFFFWPQILPQTYNSVKLSAPQTIVDNYFKSVTNLGQRRRFVPSKVNNITLCKKTTVTQCFFYLHWLKTYLNVKTFEILLFKLWMHNNSRQCLYIDSVPYKQK